MRFVFNEVQGYFPTMVREFYTNMKVNQRAETLLETTVVGKQIRITPDSIAHSLQYVRLPTSDQPYHLGLSLILMPSCSLRLCALTR